ncbi:hypothetical protein [Ralstonia phage vB_RsoP_BMB50]|uniref:Uncharacterized protein n=1 Tax=Ralstonia phage vB_RsoP_BMB50 TaxID=2834269 RepID=A0A8E5KHD4_9CAUD|nr:hypothetical protein [Ralstonia phage vB_RsoP_BMB50]
MTIRNRIIKLLGGFTQGEHYAAISLEVDHATQMSQEARREGYDRGFARAKGRATGLVDGIWAKDDLGRPINLAKLIQERV